MQRLFLGFFLVLVCCVLLATEAVPHHRVHVAVPETSSSATDSHQAAPAADQRPQSSSQSDTITNIRPLVVGNQGWVLGATSQSCDQACAAVGGSCFLSGMEAVEKSNLHNVAGYVGANCTVLNDGTTSEDPSYLASSKACWASSSTTSCSTPGGPYQRFCCCSSAPGACPVTPLLPGKQGWVLSDSRDACVTACQNVGATCNITKQSAVNSASRVSFVAGLFGLSCVADHSPASWDPNYTDGDCYYGDTASDCTSPSAGQRFCCCSSENTACPNEAPAPTTTTTSAPRTTTSLYPGNRGWVLSDVGGSCASACHSQGATCHPNAQNALVTPESVQFVADLLSVSCASVLRDASAQRYDPMVTDEMCWYYTSGSASDCDSSYKGNQVYGPGQRFCCCSNATDACPTTSSTTTVAPASTTTVTTHPPSTTSPFPGALGWVLSAKLANCASTCTAYGTTCNTVAQSAVSGSAQTAYVASLLNATCTPQSSGQVWDPNWTDSDCFYSSTAASDCGSPSTGQRFCCCSSAPGACPALPPPSTTTTPPTTTAPKHTTSTATHTKSTTTPPIPGNLGWVLSGMLETCVDTCNLYSSTCNARAQTAINTASEIAFVAGLLNVSCTPSASGQAWDPNFTSGDCYYSTSTPSDCTQPSNGQRFCCCSDAPGACPSSSSPPTTTTVAQSTTTSPLPGEQGWVLSGLQDNCVDTCYSYGTTCNAAIQASVNSSQAIGYVASLFSLSCSPSASPADWNPNFTEKDCFYGGSSSDCASSSAGQRFCCCSSAPGACPIG